MAEGSTFVTSDQLYSGLPEFAFTHGAKLGLPTHSKQNKSIVQDFLRRHLPTNRLLAKEDNISRSSIPLINPVRRKRYNRSRQKRKKLTNQERKNVQAFKIPTENQSYSQQLALHDLWKQHMEDLIPSSSMNSEGSIQAACQKLMKAELQGSILTVQRSKCPSYVGTTGIVMQETRHSFLFITPKNIVKRVPKMNSVFALEWNGHIFSIHGNHFKFRAGERSSKKFKSKPTIDL